jgi:hypothetical protein
MRAPALTIAARWPGIALYVRMPTSPMETLMGTLRHTAMNGGNHLMKEGQRQLAVVTLDPVRTSHKMQ